MNGSCAARIVLAAVLAITIVSPRIVLAGGLVSAFSSHPDRFDSPARATSSYLAGYRTEKSVTEVTSASHTFTVPNVTCSSDPEGIAVGIGNEKKKGQPTLLGVVLVYCLFGSPAYKLAALAGGTVDEGPFNTVLASHTIEVSITQSGGTVTSEVTDTSTGETVTASGTAIPDTTVTFGAFPVFINGLPMLSVPAFGSVELRSNKLDGEKIDENVQPVPRTNGAVIQISVGKLKKGKFTLTFENH